MAENSGIEWTDTTWNPVTGCTRASVGCDNCYAVAMTRRLAAMGSAKYTGLINEGKAHFNGEVKLHTELLNVPLEWNKPRMVFVNSMSDLFHSRVPDSFITDVFRTMQAASWHWFQVLTKRAERLVDLSARIDWPNNVWMGVSVENRDFVGRISLLRETAAKVKFLSLEPLLGPLPHIDLRGIDWVIVGGESGPRARPLRKEWVTEIRDQCLESDVPFFFKQWGGRDKKAAGRELEGVTWDEFPIQLREFAGF